MSKILSDEETTGQIFALLTNYIDSPSRAANAAEKIRDFIVKPQKQAHGEMVIGRDDERMELHYHGRKYDVRVRNELRAEQRKRNI